MRKIYISLLCVVATLFFAARVSAQWVAPIGATLDVPASTGSMLMDAVGDEACYSAFQTLQVCKEAGAGIAARKAGDAVDFDSKFKVCWDETYLFVYMEIIDDVAEEYVRGKEQSWTWDNFEVFLDLDTSNTVAAYADTSTMQLRINRGLMSKAGKDSIVESGFRGNAKEFVFAIDNRPTEGWTVEIAVPWKACSVADSAVNILRERAQGVIGFDIGVADADGDGTGTTGGRNVAGGAQMFWEFDDPIGNEDNAYQNRRVFGLINLIGTPVPTPHISGIATLKDVSSYRVYPNPSNGSVTFTNLEGVNEIEIYNLVGVKISTIDVNASLVRVNNLKSGIYFAKIKDQTLKFIIE